MVIDKTESESSLRSHFSSNFLSGLKLPLVGETSVRKAPSRTSSGRQEKKREVYERRKMAFDSPSTASLIDNMLVATGSLNKKFLRAKKDLIHPVRRDFSRETVLPGIPLEKAADAGGDGAHRDTTSFDSGRKSRSTRKESHLEEVENTTEANFIATPGKGKSTDIETEINQRISSVYRSIESLTKKRNNFDNSIRAAARRTAADGIRNKNILMTLQAQPPSSAGATESGGGEGNDTPTKKPSRIIDVTRTYPKMFGLDPMKVIASSEDESDADEGGERDPRKKTKKSIRKYLEQLIKDEQPRDMSAIMPTLSEKTFLTKLQKRENQLNKEINDMRNNLDVMNMKAEREAKKALAERNRQKLYSQAPTLSKLAATDANNQGPARELTNFLQSSGGTTGGWEQDDHQVFLRGWRKWSTKPSKLVENLAKLLPNKKPEDIVEHTNWFDQYEKLNNANREHIRKWQMSKKKERELLYQMANETQKAREDSERRRQETIKIRRDAEREKSKERLREWKLSKNRNKKNRMAEIGDTADRIASMDLEMLNMKKEIREITAMTRDIGKSLQSIHFRESEGEKQGTPVPPRSKSRVRTAGSDESSGFGEMTMEEIEAVAGELAGNGDNFLRRRTTSAVPPKQPIYFTKLKKDSNQVADSKKLLQDFRQRDEELIQAKKKAIMGRKEKMRNRAILTDQEIKERMKKISTPSKLMTPTKGWMIRKEMLELEKQEAQSRDTGGSGDIVDAFRAAATGQTIVEAKYSVGKLKPINGESETTA